MTNRLKAFVGRMLRSWGYTLSRVVDEPRHPFPLLPLLVKEAAALSPHFGFIQIGANDGIRNDPLRSLVLRHGLRGLLVEPVPHLMASLQGNYRDVPGIEFRQCAVGSQDGVMKFFSLAPGNPFPSWAQGLGSLSRGHLTEFGLPRVEDWITETEVPVMTMRALLAERDPQSVKLLQVDTEGHDATIVEQALEIGLRPFIIHYESVHLTAAVRAACKRRLVQAGYAFVDVPPDTIAVQDSLPFLA